MEGYVNEKKIGIVLLILISLIGTLLGCGKQDVNKDLESIEASEIKQIENIQELQAGKTVIIRIFFQIKKLLSL